MKPTPDPHDADIGPRFESAAAKKRILALEVSRRHLWQCLVDAERSRPKMRDSVNAYDADKPAMKIPRSAHARRALSTSPRTKSAGHSDVLNLWEEGIGSGSAGRTCIVHYRITRRNLTYPVSTE